MIPYSQLRDPQRTSLKDSLPLAAPWAIYLETTNICNFKCKFCPESFADYEEQSGGYATMDDDMFAKIVQDIRAMGRIKVLRFYSLGEPLLNRKIGEMIHDCRNLAERTELTTNATALTGPRGVELIASGLDYLRVSVYAMGADRHESITGSRIDPLRIYNNVRDFFYLRGSKRKPFLYVKMIDSGDEDENKFFLDMYSPICDEAVIEKPMDWNGYDGRDLTLDSKRDDLFPYKKHACPFPFYTMNISANGDVTCCCVDWNKKTKVGNVREETLAEIWNGDALRDFQRMHLDGRRHENESCKNCTYLFTNPDNIDGIEIG